MGSNPGAEWVEFNYVKGFFFYFSIPIAAMPGAIVDICSKYLKRSTIGVTVILTIASLSAFTFSAMQAASAGHLILAETSVFFGVLSRTFTYSSFAVFINFSKLI